MLIEDNIVKLLHLLIKIPIEDNVQPPRNREQVEERLGKIKFIIPKFKGEQDPDAYIEWELKVDKIFRLHNYTEEKKVALASLEFEGLCQHLVGGNPSKP